MTVVTGGALGPTAVQRAGEHLLGTLDQLVEEITDRVWRSVPVYNDILVDRLALQQQVKPNILDTLEFMRTGRDIDDDDRARLDELGRSRALQGVPLAAMVQSFRTAERVLVDAFCVFCIRSAVNSAEQRAGIQAISAILDKVESLTFVAYLETMRHLQQDHTSSVTVLVSRLIDGPAGDRVEVDAQVRLFGANPSLPYRCIALALVPDQPAADDAVLSEWDATDPTSQLTRLRRHIAARLIEARVPTPIVGVRADTLILLTPVTRRDALAAVARAIEPSQYRAAVAAGAGDKYDNLFDARESCHQALAALDVGLRTRRVRQVTVYDDVVSDVLLLANRDACARLIRSYLTPLADQPVLDETVRVYTELGQSAQAAAGRLVVHVNTIAYRLRRVRELTGHDIRQPDAGVNFYLALRARELLAGD